MWLTVSCSCHHGPLTWTVSSFLHCVCQKFCHHNEKSNGPQKCWLQFWNTGSSRSRCQSVCWAAPHWWYILYVLTGMKDKHAPFQIFACTYTWVYGPVCVQEHMQVCVWAHMCEGMYAHVCKCVRARSHHCFLGWFATGLNKSQVD